MSLSRLRQLNRQLWLFLSLPPSHKSLTLAIAWHLARARLELLHRPFKSIASELGQVGCESGPQCRSLQPSYDPEFPLLLSGYVRRLAPLMPFQALCLVQALAVARLLAPKGYAFTVYLGVRTGDSFEAHAWLRWGDTILCGAPQHLNYKVVTTFSNLPLANGQQ